MSLATITPVLARARSFGKNRLFMNALYLMLATLVTAGSGFLFWTVATHTHSETVVGQATTLVSVSTLLSLLGLAGFDISLVRFLPASRHKHSYITTSLSVTGIATAGLSVIAAIAMPYVSNQLSLMHSPLAIASFSFFTVATALNVLTNAVFLAYRQARTILIVNCLFGACKVILPLAFTQGNALLVFNLAGLAQLVGFGLSLAWMRRQFNYQFSLGINWHFLRVVRRFSLFVYTANILNLLPPTLLPLLIVRHLGAAQTAYYYIAFTVAGTLYTIAYASMQSAFAESVYDESALRQHLGKAARLVGSTLIPAALLICVGASLVLQIFGQAYATNATSLLQLFTLAAVPVAGYSALGAFFKVTKQLRAIVTMNVVYCVVILLASSLLLPYAKLQAIGWGWICGNVAACFTGLLWVKYKTRERKWRAYQSQAAIQDNGLEY